MSIIPVTRRQRGNGYPTSDGKPMAETDDHRCLMVDLIASLEAYYAADAMVYVSGDLLVCYEKGSKRKHVAPDVFVAKGVEKKRRKNYLIWEEKPLNVVIELTSSTTKSEDTKVKKELYQDVLKVREYFLFDPNGDYLDPRLQGYRLLKGTYQPIAEVAGRLPSLALKLHLERAGNEVRLWNPATGAWLPTSAERITQEAEQRAKEKERADREKERADQLQRELDELRGKK